MQSALTSVEGGLYVNLHAQPGARREALCGMHGDAIKLAVRQAPEGGKANAAIVDFLAAALGLGKRQIEVTSGHTSRRKRLFIQGDAADIAERLKELIPDA